MARRQNMEYTVAGFNNYLAAYGAAAGVTYRGEWLNLYDQVFLQDFSGGVPAWTFVGGTPTIVSDTSDPGYDRQCLTFPDVIDDGVASAEFTVTIPATAKYLSVRYHLESEEEYDFFGIYVDGVLGFETSGIKSGFLNGLVAVSPGVHTIKFQYSKDGSGDGGYDNVRIAHVFTSPRLEWLMENDSYAKDSVVFWDGRYYIALVDDTPERPSPKSSHWRVLSTDTAPVLVLAAEAEVPEGTGAGTVIVRPTA